MSWTNELYRVYELAVGTEAEKDMLPISHSTANAQIEITVNEDGDFVNAAVVDKENAETIIPVTEDSAARSSGITPMPLADKLIYIAGDYGKYAKGKHADNSEYFKAYMEQLGKWCKSSRSHFAVNAVYAYLEKKQVVSDLVKSGILVLENGKFNDTKFNNISQEDSFVRFIVSSANGLCYTWLDTALYKCFRDYYESTLDSSALSYADGKIGAVTYKHPSKIRNSGDKAKLISANDSTNYTYRGRFKDSREAVAVSYDYSQKMHIALKWLVKKQSRSYDSLTLITWNSALGFVPSLTKSVFEAFEDDVEEFDTKAKFSELLNKMLLGGKEFSVQDKVMIMGLDAATTGRLSIALYTELAESDFYRNLKKWHTETSWNRYNGKLKKTVEDSCSLPRIAECLYGREQNGFLSCEKSAVGQLILRLLPCVTEGKRIPHDIVVKICENASSPLSYEKEYNHRILIENACALVKKENTEHNNDLYYKGGSKMAYDPNCTDRSYLYGCLLAIADKAERDTYEKGEERVTNARRLWSAFAARPYQTWAMIEERLEPYLEKNQWTMVNYTKHINEIMSRMSPEVFADNSKLSPMYLIGYHHYNALLWNENKTDTDSQ